MRAVLDTNVWVSALIQPRGPSGLVVGALVHGSLDVASTEHLWSELSRALSYPRVRKIFDKRGDGASVAVLLARFRALVQFVPEVAPTGRWVAEDADDDWVVQGAMTAGADCIVTGDARLQEVGAVGTIQVVSPTEMAALLGLAPSRGSTG